MKNFIQINIDNVKGNRRGSSLIEREPKYFSPVKAKSKYLNEANDNNKSTVKKKYYNIRERVAQLEESRG